MIKEFLLVLFFSKTVLLTPSPESIVGDYVLELDRVKLGEFLP